MLGQWARVSDLWRVDPLCQLNGVDGAMMIVCIIDYIRLPNITCVLVTLETLMSAIFCRWCVVGS